MGGRWLAFLALTRTCRAIPACFSFPSSQTKEASHEGTPLFLTSLCFGGSGGEIFQGFDIVEAYLADVGQANHAIALHLGEAARDAFNRQAKIIGDVLARLSRSSIPSSNSA